MENNRRRSISRFALAMAEAQHRQALAAYWPQIGLRGSYQRMDESPNFLFPATQVNVPAQTLSMPPGTASITLPAGAFGNQFPLSLPIAYPGQTVEVPAQRFDVPEQDVKLMDPSSYMTSLNATWLLYDGGMRKGLKDQASAWVAMAKQDFRRTDLEITDGVKRLYYGAILARQLRQIGQDTLARMEATLRLTETMFKEGGGRVTKADFLDNKVMTETLRAALAQLEKNEQMAEAALANTMGLPWSDSVRPADNELPFAPGRESLQNLVSTAYQFNPDWSKVEDGIRAAEAAVRTSVSGHYPKVALTGDLHRWWNDYDAGLATDRNREGWTVGVGVEVPVFTGFLTKNRIAEARAQLEKAKQQQLLLKDGLGLQVKDLLLNLAAAQKAFQATFDAMQSAQENRQLNIQAYQNELVETEKVIRAQLVEALMSAQHYKTRYDHLALQSQLSLLVGTEVLKQLPFTP